MYRTRYRLSPPVPAATDTQAIPRKRATEDPPRNNCIKFSVDRALRVMVRVCGPFTTFPGAGSEAVDGAPSRTMTPKRQRVVLADPWMSPRGRRLPPQRRHHILRTTPCAAGPALGDRLVARVEPHALRPVDVVVAEQ